MKKILSILSIIFLLAFSALAEDDVVVVGSVPAAPGGPDVSSITYWWTFESLGISTGDHSDGTTTITADGGAISASAEKYGTNGAAYTNEQVHYFASASILTAAEGRIGLWVQINTWAGDAPILGFGLASAPSGWSDDYARLEMDGTDELHLLWKDDPIEVYRTTTGANLATGTYYFIEVAWNKAGNICDVYVNGTKFTTGSAAISGSTFTVAQLFTGISFNYSANVYIDNLIISTDSTLDLYTNFGALDDYPG